MANGDDVDNDLLLGLLTGAIVAPVALPVDRETVLLLLLLFVVVICCCCFFGAAATLATAVGFVVVVVCCGGDDDDIADVGGVADDNEGGFTVFGIPHICDSVVLTTLRLGLLGSHILALISGDIVVLGELVAAVDGDTADDCCAYTWILLQIPKNNRPTRTENNVKIERELLILKYIDAVLLFI
jgi:hypothetical protein